MEVAVPVNMYLDDKSYNTTLPTPENIVINGNQVTWNAVGGAEKYVVNVNGIDETIVTTTSYDISSYQESVTIMIKASADGKVDEDKQNKRAFARKY